MIFHYIKIAVRNLKKYKAQTAISVVSMAVGIMLLAVMHSLILFAFEDSAIENNPEFSEVHYAIGEASDHPAFLQKLENRGFKTVDRYYAVPLGAGSSQIVLETEGEEKAKSINAIVVPIRQEVLDFMYLRSALTGDLLKKLDNESVIVTEFFAQNTYGTTDVIGKQISFYTYNQVWTDEGKYQYYKWNWTEYKTFVIADVMHTNSNDPIGGEIFYKTENIYGQTSKIYIIPTKGCHYKELCDELIPFANELISDYQYGSVLEIGYQPWSMHGSPDELDKTIIGKTILYTIVSLILLAAFLGYIRMQIQLFWMRQREIALRTVVGGQKKSLFALFFTEVSIIMLMTCGTAILACQVAKDQLGVAFVSMMKSRPYGGLAWDMSNFEQYVVVITTILALISLLFVMLTVYQIRKSQTGLALQMKPQSNHRMRTVALGFQMVLSTVFIAVSLMLFQAKGKLLEESAIINSKAFAESYPIGIYGSEEVMLEKHAMIDAMEHIEKKVDYTSMYINYNADQCPEYLSAVHGYQVDVYFQENNEIVDYLDLKVKPVPCSASRENTIYVSDKLYDSMTKGGTEAAPAFEIDGVMTYVAGTYNLLPGFSGSVRAGNIIWNKKSPYPMEYHILLTAEKGYEAEVAKKLTEIRDYAVETPAMDPVRQMKDSNDKGELLVTTIINIMYFLTIINIIGTSSSLYSAVSLDVLRRRKEVMLRKINGAISKDIFKLFAKEYLILLGVCAVLALPISYIASIVASNVAKIQDAMGYVMAFMASYMEVVLLISFVTAITVGWKIWGIMHLKPVEGIKE